MSFFWRVCFINIIIRITSAKLITESFLLLLAIIATIVSTLVYLENKKYVNLFDRGMEVISEILI